MFSAIFMLVSNTDQNYSIIDFIFPRVIMLSFLILPFILIDKNSKIIIALCSLFILFLVFGVDIFRNALGIGFFQVQVQTANYYQMNFLMLFPVIFIIFGLTFLLRINGQYEDKISQLIKNLEDKNNLLEKSNEEILTQKETIELKNKNITESIQYARKIQTAFLPKPGFIANHFPNSFVYYQPKDIVSGDFYWLRHIDNMKIVIVADCTGHGVPGALLSILGITLLNDYIINKQIYQPAQLLNALRNGVKESLTQTGINPEQKDGMDIAVCIYNVDTAELTYAGANCPIILIQNNELTELKPNRQPIGYYIKEVPFEQISVSVTSNSMFYLFSDGLESQFGGEKNTRFKKKLLYNLLFSVSDFPLDEQKNTIESEFYNWKGKMEQIDDILLVGVRV